MHSGKICDCHLFYYIVNLMFMLSGARDNTYLVHGD